MRDLTEFVGVQEATKIYGASTTTLRSLADSGKIRTIRDPAGRRLLLRRDVERLAVERGKRETAVS